MTNSISLIYKLLIQMKNRSIEGQLGEITKTIQKNRTEVK